MTESIAQDGTQVDDRLVHPVEAGPTDTEADEEAPRRELSQERQVVSERGYGEVEGVDKMQQKAWLCLFALFYLLVSAAIIAGHAENSTEKERSEKELQEEFKESGATLADLLQRIKALEKEAAEFRAEARRERAARIQLNEEVQILRKENERLRDRMEAEIINEVLEEGQKLRLEATRTWWEWLTGTAPPGVEVERTTTIEGCQDLKCCFGMWWTTVGELFHQTTDLIYRFVWDPYGTGGHWASGLFSAGFWGPVLGITILVVVVNLLLLAVFRAADIWKGMKGLASRLGGLPMFKLVGMAFSKLRRGEGPEGTSPELQEMRRTVEKLQKTVETSQRKGKEQREMRELRGQVENLMAKCEQQAPPGEDVQTKTMREMQAFFQQQLDQLRREFIHTGKQPGPAPIPVDMSPRRRQHPGSMPPGGRQRYCERCKKWHPGLECWDCTKCRTCGATGMCEHRAKIVENNRRRSPTPRPERTRAVAVCEREESEAMWDWDARLVEEASQTGSSISFSTKGEGSGEPGTQESVVAVVDKEAKGYRLRGHLAVGGGVAPCTFLIDTGSEVNLLSEKTCTRLGVGIQSAGPDKPNLAGVSGKRLEVTGQAILETRFGQEEGKAIRYWVAKNVRDIIGIPGIGQLGISLTNPGHMAVFPSGQKLFCQVMQKN